MDTTTIRIIAGILFAVVCRESRPRAIYSSNSEGAANC